MGLIQLPMLITQILGFLILLWVLRKFLWGPMLGMLEARRQKVATDIHDAEKLKQDAERLKAEYEEQLRTIEAQARERIQQAVAEGQKVADEMRAHAREEAQAITAKAKADLDMEYKKARAQLRNDVVGLTLGATERLLGETVDDDRHRKLVDRFLDELQTREAR